MNFEQTSTVMHRIAPELGRIARALCDGKAAECVICDAVGSPVVGTIDDAQPGADAPVMLAPDCAGCREQVSQLLKVCLIRREEQVWHCAAGHTLFAAPMIESELPLGVLLARYDGAVDGDTADGTFTAEAVRSTAGLAARTVFREMESINLTEDLSVRYEELSLLYEIGERLPLESSPSSILAYVLRKAAEAVDCSCSVWVSVHDASATTHARNAQGDENGEPEPEAERCATAVTELAGESTDTLMWRNLASRLGAGFEATPFRSALAAPVEAGLERYGWLVLLRTEEDTFLSSEAKIIASLARRSGVSMQNAALYRDLRDLFLNTIKTLVFVIEGKDPYTRGHSERVNVLAMRLGRALGLDEEALEALNWSSLLHDIGKLKIPERILQKDGKLTPRELTVIQYHTTYGAELLSPIQQLARCLPGVRHHHERYDGHGYPSGLKGEDIPLQARIISVADTWDALTSDRCYRPRFSADKAADIVSENSGTQLDPAIVEVFLSRRAELAPETPPQPEDAPAEVLAAAGLAGTAGVLA